MLTPNSSIGLPLPCPSSSAGETLKQELLLEAGNGYRRSAGLRGCVWSLPHLEGAYKDDRIMNAATYPRI